MILCEMPKPDGSRWLYYPEIMTDTVREAAAIFAMEKEEEALARERRRVVLSALGGSVIISTVN